MSLGARICPTHPHAPRPRPHPQDTPTLQSGAGTLPPGPALHPTCPRLAGLTAGSSAAGLAPPRCRGCGRSRLRCRPPHQAQHAGSADTPGPRSRRCCTPTPRVWARGSCSGSGLRTRTAEGAKGQGKVDAGTIASSTPLSRPSWILNTRSAYTCTCDSLHIKCTHPSVTYIHICVFTHTSTHIYIYTPNMITHTCICVTNEKNGNFVRMYIDSYKHMN